MIAALALVSTLACASEITSANASATDETGGRQPDLPSAPELVCPAALGELAECECGYVDACAIEAEDPDACTVACAPEPACDTVMCEFDSAHGFPACVTVSNPEALDCTLAALGSGEPVAVGLWLRDTYVNANHDDIRRINRLAGAQALIVRDYSQGFHGSHDTEFWLAKLVELDGAELDACVAADTHAAAFDCLMAMTDGTAEPACADPAAIACPP